MNSTWGALDRRLDSGQLLLPGTAVFERARRGFNRRYDEVVPQAIVRCRTAGDVSAAIGFAAAHDLKLAVRSGGHCFAGNSATEGLLIDTSPMRAHVSLTNIVALS
jgi:FAD/FMN-containing dehydrogenase